MIKNIDKISKLCRERERERERCILLFTNKYTSTQIREGERYLISNPSRCNL